MFFDLAWFSVPNLTIRSLKTQKSDQNAGDEHVLEGKPVGWPKENLFLPPGAK